MTETEASTPEAKRARWLASQAWRLLVTILGETESCKPMLLKLRDEVVPRYREAYERSGLPEGSWDNWLWISQGPGKLQHEVLYYLLGQYERDSSSPPDQPAKGKWEFFRYSTIDWRAVPDAVDAFRKWADSYGVVDEWLVRLLSQVCVRWATDESAAESLDTTPPTRPVTADDLLGEDEEQPPDLGYYLIHSFQSSGWRRWAPEAESWESYRARAVAAFTRFLDHEYKPTLEPMPKGSKLPPSIEEHLSWVARHYLGGEVVERISEDVNKTPKTVRDGIKSKRELIGLTVPKRGK